MPPKAMAPWRPLPTGRASVQILAGWRYQRDRGSSGGGAWPVSLPEKAGMGVAELVAARTGEARSRRKARDFVSMAAAPFCVLWSMEGGGGKEGEIPMTNAQCPIEGRLPR